MIGADCIGLAICLPTRNGENGYLCKREIQWYTHVHYRKWCVEIWKVLLMHNFLACSDMYVMDLVGYVDENDPNSTIEEFLYDVKRVEYMAAYLDALSTAVR